MLTACIVIICCWRIPVTTNCMSPWNRLACCINMSVTKGRLQGFLKWAEPTGNVCRVKPVQRLLSWLKNCCDYTRSVRSSLVMLLLRIPNGSVTLKNASLMKKLRISLKRSRRSRLIWKNLSRWTDCCAVMSVMVKQKLLSALLLRLLWMVNR